MSLWDRLKEESYPAYRAFLVYRDLGPARSIDSAWRKHQAKRKGNAPGNWNDWCRKFSWVDRASAYDTHLLEIEQKAFEREYAKLAARRARFELRAQELLEDQVERIDKVLKKAESAPITDTVERKKGLITRRKGINFAGYAKLHKERRDAIAQAVTGLRKTEESSGTQAPKQVCPEWLALAIAPQPETKVEHDDTRSDDGQRPDLRAADHAAGNAK